MGPSRAHGPSAGPDEANVLPEAHGPPKVHGPRGHCTPCPPLSVALLWPANVKTSQLIFFIRKKVSFFPDIGAKLPTRVLFC